MYKLGYNYIRNKTLSLFCTIHFPAGSVAETGAIGLLVFGMGQEHELLHQWCFPIRSSLTGKLPHLLNHMPPVCGASFYLNLW